MQPQDRARGRQQRRREDTPEVSPQSASSISGGKSCPVCSTPNPPEALFCRECGHNFQVPTDCPSCGNPLLPEADICESCGTWVGGTGCKFCGHFLAEGATFCPSCGNPREGIRCSSCGRLSFFDFCPRCHSCLTESGSEAREEAAKSELGDIVRQLSRDFRNSTAPPEGTDRTKRSGESTSGFDEKTDLSRLKQYLRKVDGSSSSHTGKSGEAPRKQTGGKTARVQPAGPDAGQQEKLRKMLEELLERSRSRSFADNQSARRYFMASRPPDAVGWLCNRNGLLHPSPMDCAAAREGGRWVLEWNGITDAGQITWGTVEEA